VTIGSAGALSVGPALRRPWSRGKRRCRGAFASTEPRDRPIESTQGRVGNLRGHVKHMGGWSAHELMSMYAGRCSRPCGYIEASLHSSLPCDPGRVLPPTVQLDFQLDPMAAEELGSRVGIIRGVSSRISVRGFCPRTMSRSLGATLEESEAEGVNGQADH